MQAYVVLSTKCNLRCSHCIRNFTEKTSNELEYEDTKSIFDSIYKNNPKTHLILTGGEPTLHPNFFPILSYAETLFKNITVCSNGVYSDDILKQIVTYSKSVVQISLDGTKEIHDLIRGDGNFEKSINSIRQLTSHNILTTISTTVNKQNKHSILELGNILSKFKINKWQIEMEQVFSEKEAEKKLNISEWNSFVDLIVNQIKLPLSIKKIYDFDVFKKMEIKYGKEFLAKIANPNCGCCKSKYYIYPDKTVRICTCIENVLLGNLRHETLDTILKRMPSMRRILDVRENTPCYNCEWLYFCNGGCPGYSNYIFKEFGHGDIRCPRVKAYYGL